MRIKNRQLKRLIYATLRASLDLLVEVLRHLSLGSIYSLSEYLGDMFYLLAQGYRRRVLYHMRIALGGEKSEDDIRDIAKKATRNLIGAPLEVLHLMISSANGIGARMTLEGREYLDRAFMQEKGIIGISAHFGNFMIMGAKFASEGYSFNMLVKDPTEEWYPGWAQAFRDQMGYKTIPLSPRELCARKILKALINNEIVCMLTDDDKSPGGVFIDFFGKKAATAVGPATLSLKTGAPILPMFIIQQPDNTHKIIIEPPIKVDISGNRDIDVLKITQAFTQVIETYVRKYPDHWNWSRRRWKTQPMQLGDMDNKCAYRTDRGI